LAQTDADAAARQARLALEGLLADAPALAPLPPGFGDAMERFVALLLDANQRLNLTRIVMPDEVARRHLLDALAGLPHVDRVAPRVAVDLGSGGGLPGIPLAAARPDVRWILVDAVAKKADALRGFAEALQLRNVRVVAERAETLGRLPEHRDRHDLVVARACAPLPVLAELALPLLRVGGRLVAWKGLLTDADEEIVRGRIASERLGGERLTIEDAAVPGTRFVMVGKARPTPDRFPRRPGVPARRPLA
jgi:16S rRNA (guanine527-N7)-methyltransferase